MEFLQENIHDEVEFLQLFNPLQILLSGTVFLWNFIYEGLALQGFVRGRRQISILILSELKVN